MARDAALMKSGSLVARVYTWDGPWVSLGASQSRERDLLPGAQIPSVPRPTGGRAVLHGHDVTVGLYAPFSQLAVPGEDLSRSVRKVYRRIIAPLIDALNAVGVDAALGEETPWTRSVPKSADCFAHVSSNDVVDPSTGLKRCGCALKLSDQGVLVQASLPASKPLVDPASIFRVAAPAHWAPIPLEPFAAALAEALSRLQRVAPATR